MSAKADTEPRASEVIAEIADPKILRRIFATYGPPPPPPPRSPEELEYEAYAERIRKTLKAVRPERIAKIEAHTTNAERFAFRPKLQSMFERPFPPPRPSIHHGKSLEVLEVNRPTEVEDGLRVAVPQAILRDLHRVVSVFEAHFERESLAPESIDLAAEMRKIVNDLRAAYAKVDPIGMAYAKPALAELAFQKQSSWVACAEAVKAPQE